MRSNLAKMLDICGVFGEIVDENDLDSLSRAVDRGYEKLFEVYTGYARARRMFLETGGYMAIETLDRTIEDWVKIMDSFCLLGRRAALLKNFGGKYE